MTAAAMAVIEALCAALREAQAERDALKAEVEHLNAMLNPRPETE